MGIQQYIDKFKEEQEETGGEDEEFETERIRDK
jgi:hypothetical protein